MNIFTMPSLETDSFQKNLLWKSPLLMTLIAQGNAQIDKKRLPKHKSNICDVFLLKRKKNYQNFFLNVHTLNITNKLQMISFIEESFNHGTNAEYSYTCYIPLNETHLDLMRGLIHQEVSPKCIIEESSTECCSNSHQVNRFPQL